MPTLTESARGRRIELILRQIDALPTLPAVAARLLSLTASDDSHVRDVIQLVKSDPTLTARILSLCRQADMGVRSDVLTIDKAVVLLGFNAVRNAVLSVKVFELFEDSGISGRRTPDDAESDPTAPRPAEVQPFDRTGFWRHSLAVAIAAEAIADAHPGQVDLPAAEAFVCGLLHDIGKLALHDILPRSFDRVLELTELNQGNIAEFERRIIGLDHHTAGKRLAEQWQLPHRLQDCIWLHGTPWNLLPKLEHRRLVGLVTLADLVVRQQHLGFSGNYALGQDAAALAEAAGLNAACLPGVIERLVPQLEQRSALMGLDEQPTDKLLMQSIQHANQMLGRLNGVLERRSRQAQRQAQVLEAINAFHAGAQPGRSVQDVMGAVIRSAATMLGDGFYAMLYQPTAGEAWLVCQYTSEGRSVHSQLVEPPPGCGDLWALAPQEPLSLSAMGILPWIADYLVDAPDVRKIRLLPLGSGWGTAAMMLHNREALPPWQQLAVLAGTWGSAIAAAGQHDGARRLGEELAQANLALAQAQERLLRADALTRLAEMAAGAAHEMNNPLAVISGRSQLLALGLHPGSEQQKAAQTIVEQSQRLSDLISSLRLFADPPKPNRQPTNLAHLVDDVIKEVRQEEDKPMVSLRVQGELPRLLVDAAMIRLAVRELVHNALQAGPREAVHVTTRAELATQTVQVQVVDDGVGMDSHTLAHAMDPFFSNKPAGRRVGMGLPRAQQMAAAHGGQILLRSVANQGTTATLVLPLDSPD